jgi:hypothetical protein
VISLCAIWQVNKKFSNSIRLQILLLSSQGY